MVYTNRKRKLFSVNSLFLTVFTWKLSPLQDEPGVKMQVKIMSCFKQLTL